MSDSAPCQSPMKNSLFVAFCSMFRQLRMLSQQAWSFNIRMLLLWLGTLQVTLDMLDWTIERLQLWISEEMKKEASGESRGTVEAWVESQVQNLIGQEPDVTVELPWEEPVMTICAYPQDTSDDVSTASDEHSGTVAQSSRCDEHCQQDSQYETDDTAPSPDANGTTPNVHEASRVSTSMTSTAPSRFVKINKTVPARTNTRPHKKLRQQRPTTTTTTTSLDPDPERATRLDRLAHALFTRYELDHGIADLNNAITYHREALHLRPPGHPERVRSLAYLARALMSKFECEGDTGVLPEAFMYAQEGRTLLPVGTSRCHGNW